MTGYTIIYTLYRNLTNIYKLGDKYTFKKNLIIQIIKGLIK